MHSSTDRLAETPLAVSPSPRPHRPPGVAPRTERFRRALAGLVAVVFLGDLAS